jgi:hypothetical protein
MNFQTYRAILRTCGCAVLLTVAVTGCDLGGLLDVTDPSRLLSEDVEVPAQADALMNGMEADFICAHGAFVVSSADLTDEFEDHTPSGDAWTLDRRRPQNQDAWGDGDCTGAVPGLYVSGSRSRWVADNLVSLLSGWTDAEVSNRAERMARASLLSGFSLSMLGATICTAALDQGPELSSQQMFAEAESRFTDAMIGGTSDITNAARVGRARVRLYMGDDGGALIDAQAVPAGFVMNIFPSDANTRLWNRVWHRNLFTFGFGVPPWSRDLLTGGVPDPRTATFNTTQQTGWGPGDVWGQMKYSTSSTPMPIARYEEAQLIIGEITGGATAVAVINALRLPHSLPTFSSSVEADIQDMIIEERRRELWFEGFRLYDVRRHDLPLFPTPGTPYQVGIKGGSYGDQTCIPLHIVETFNNPTIRG